MTQQQLDPTDKLSATLEAQQWNQVLALLQEGPYRIVAPLIQTLTEQLQAPQSALPQDKKPSNVVPIEAG